ncbi:hypothetical protein [Thiomicrorhabdus sp.]
MLDLDNIGSALLLTLSLLGISILIVGLAMWWLYRFFRHDDAKSKQEEK